MTEERTIILDGETLSLDEIVSIAKGEARVELSTAALDRVDAARACVERRLETDAAFYGINTGFGYLSDIRIDKDKLSLLQKNLVRSHACGVGEPLPREVVRAVLALRMQTMLRGHSGVRRETVLLMREFLERDIAPIVPRKGSVGASGDLAPLAHLALALIGEGEVLFEGERMPSAAALSRAGLAPLDPGPKEGLCLINGTQVMTALGLLALDEAKRLATAADVACAMTVDAYRGTAVAFRDDIQAVRPHPGQAAAARNVRLCLEDDAIARSHADCHKVQDPYSIRCAPQVHGAARDAIEHVERVLLREACSSTDNPLVFAETDEILSGGNFHGEPVALALDYLAMAVAELASISERRIEKLINPHMSGLPAFLTRETGLNSGYMIPHVVAAALVGENKVLCHPASVDSIDTSADKEDHVSMGMTAALKLGTVVENASRVLAIEVLAAAEGLDILKPLEGGRGVRAALSLVREHAAPMVVDRSLSAEIESLALALRRGSLGDRVSRDLGRPLD